MEFDALKEIIAETLSVDANSITEETKFIDDLDADSLDVVEIIMAIEDRFEVEISDEDAADIKTVGDAVGKIKAALA